MTDLLQQLQASLGASYEVQRELTAGGMSRVFLAEDKALGRRVVIKVLSPMLSAELSHERFRREIRVAASLQHPHIVPLLTAGEANGLPYFTMPFVEGMVSSTILTLVGDPRGVRILEGARTARAHSGHHANHRRAVAGNGVKVREAWAQR